VRYILKDDDSGQFILLMSVIVAVGLVIILVFFNQSLMAGYSSAQSIMDFPKNDIRDFRSATVNEAQGLGVEMNDNINASRNEDPNTFNSTFNGSFNNYIGQIQDIFAQQGTLVEVTYQNNVAPVIVNDSVYNRTYTFYMCNYTIINLYYNNGETSYDDNTTVYYDWRWA